MEDEPVTETVDHPEHANPTPHTPPPVDPPAAHATSNEALESLEKRVADLEGTLNSLVSIRPDTSPVRRPWTHRRIMGR